MTCLDDTVCEGYIEDCGCAFASYHFCIVPTVFPVAINYLKVLGILYSVMLSKIMKLEAGECSSLVDDGCCD